LILNSPLILAQNQSIQDKTNSKDSKISDSEEKAKKDYESKMDADQKLLDDLRKKFLKENELLEQYFQRGFINKIDKLFQNSIKNKIQIYREFFKPVNALFYLYLPGISWADFGW